jgi:hypothetical protein
MILVAKSSDLHDPFLVVDQVQHGVVAPARRPSGRWRGKWISDQIATHSGVTSI